MTVAGRRWLVRRAANAETQYFAVDAKSNSNPRAELDTEELSMGTRLPGTLPTFIGCRLQPYSACGGLPASHPSLRRIEASSSGMQALAPLTGELTVASRGSDCKPYRIPTAG